MAFTYCTNCHRKVKTKFSICPGCGKPRSGPDGSPRDSTVTLLKILVGIFAAALLYLIFS